MKMTKIIPVGALCLVLILISATFKTMSNGAPLGNTGAPGDQSCSKAGCHTGAEQNSGSGIMQLTAGENLIEYEPGKTYDINVSLTQAGIKRFGFQCLALGPDGKSIGELIINEPDRTQILKGVNQYEGRSYVTYTYSGTNPYETGKGQWTFKWKAPQKGGETVNFYAATVAANDDGTDDGDTVYTASLQLASGSETGVEAVPGFIAKKVLNVYPNPAQNRLTINFDVAATGSTSINIYDLQGKLWLSRSINMGNATNGTSMDISELKSGVYIMRVIHNGELLTRRFMVE